MFMPDTVRVSYTFHVSFLISRVSDVFILFHSVGKKKMDKLLIPYMIVSSRHWKWTGLATISYLNELAEITDLLHVYFNRYLQLERSILPNFIGHLSRYSYSPAHSRSYSDWNDSEGSKSHTWTAPDLTTRLMSSFETRRDPSSLERNLWLAIITTSRNDPDSFATRRQYIYCQSKFLRSLSFNVQTVYFLAIINLSGKNRRNLSLHVEMKHMT